MNDGAKKLLDEVLAKPVNALDEYDKSILRARKSYLSEAQIREYADIFPVEKPKEEKKTIKK